MVDGLFVNIIKKRVSFAKRLESGRTLNRIEGKGGAFGQNSPFFFLLPSRRIGEAHLGADGGLGHGGGRS